LTVPKEWVDRNKLSHKEIKIEEQQNQLILQAEDYKRPFKERTIFVSYNNVNNIRGIIFSMIRLGYDRFELAFKKEDKEEFVKNTRHVIDNYIYGYEISEIKEKSCVITNIVPFTQEIDAVEKKSFHIVKETFIEVIELLKNNKKNIEEINNLNKRMVQCDSILRHNYSNYPLKNSPFKWQEYRDCYVIQRELFNLIRALVTKSKTQKDRVVPLLEKLSVLFDQIYLSYYKGSNPGELEKTGILAAELEEKTIQEINRIKEVDQIILCYVFEIARTLNMFNHSLLQIKFQEEDQSSKG